MKVLSEFWSELLGKRILSFTEIKITTPSVQTPLKQETHSSYTMLPTHDLCKDAKRPVFQEYLSHPHTNQWAPAGIYVASMTLKTWRHTHIMTSMMSQVCSLRVTKLCRIWKILTTWECKSCIRPPPSFMELLTQNAQDSFVNCIVGRTGPCRMSG